MPPPPQPISNRSEPARGSSLQTIKTQQRAKDDEERIKQRRKKGVMVMVLELLREQGYARSLDALQCECGISLGKYCQADNVDLMTIVTEYEDYHEFKFGRTPKLFRAIESGSEECGGGNAGNDGERMLTRKSSTPPDQHSTPLSFDSTTSMIPPPSTAPAGASSGRLLNGTSGVKVSSSKGVSSSQATTGGSLPPIDGSESGLTGKTIKLRKSDTLPEMVASESNFVGRAMKPFPRFPTAELNDLATTIQRDILDVNPSVSWDDIAELHEAKQLLTEAVVMPMKYPQLFADIVRPWKGILLFGPPGTGKTMLAKAVATECRTTFFNISASTIVSKWRGDSEKLVRMLFELALHYAPSTVFIDELDSLMSQRTSDGSEHEGSRRMKTELLVQMDGLAKRQGGDGVFVLAASNVPWDLDTAMLRRLEKRILVPLPCLIARREMFRKNLKSVVANFDFEAVAAATEGHSGADIDIICREATMRTVRLMIEKLERGNGKELASTPLARPCVTLSDAMESIRCTRSSAGNVDLRKYSAWEAKHGSGISSTKGPQ